jgi:hypothetical protein
LRALLSGALLSMQPKIVDWYSNWANRGYLAKKPEAQQQAA